MLLGGQRVALEAELPEVRTVGSQVLDLFDVVDPVVAQVQVAQRFLGVEVLYYFDEVVVQVKLPQCSVALEPIDFIDLIEGQDQRL